MSILMHPARPSDPHTRHVVLGEALSAGDPIYLYDDAGTPTVKKVASPFGARLEMSDLAMYIRNCPVTTNVVAVLYRRRSSSDGWVVAVDVSNPENPIEGTPVQVSTGSTYYLHCFQLADGKIVLLFRDGTGYIQARVATVSGLVITLGTAAVCSAGSAYYPYGCRISDTQFCVSFRDGGVSYHGQARLGSVSGSTITWGTAATFYAASAGYSCCIWATSPDYIIIAYRGGGSDLYVIRSDISGNNFVGFTGSTLLHAGSYYYVFDMREIASNKFVICARNGSYANLTMFTQLGFTLTHQESVQLTSSLSYYAAMANPQNSQLFAIYTYETGPYQGRYKTAMLPGVNFDALSEPTTFHNQRLSDLDVCTNTYGASWQVVLSWVEYSTYKTFLQVVDSLVDSFDLSLGVLEESGALGETRRITLLGGLSRALSGYPAGQKLYIQPDASIGSTASTFPFAVALDGDQALLGKTLLAD